MFVIRKVLVMFQLNGSCFKTLSIDVNELSDFKSQNEHQLSSNFVIVCVCAAFFVAAYFCIIDSTR